MDPNRANGNHRPPKTASTKPWKNSVAVSSRERNRKAVEGTEEVRDDQHPSNQTDDHGSDCEDVDHPSDWDRIEEDGTCPGSRPKNDHPCLPVGDGGYRERANPILPKSAAGGSTVDKNL